MAHAEPAAPTLAQRLVRATHPFAREDRRLSWWFLGTTLFSIVGVLVIATIAPWWPLRLCASMFGALMMVRGFILFHDFMDFMHGAILRDSRLANVLMHLFGSLLLVPPRSWKASHNHHHAHVGKIAETSSGAYPILTVEQWRAAGFRQRLHYAGA